jgi:hypothetical protein
MSVRAPVKIGVERDCGLPRHSLYNRQQDSVWHKNKLIFQDLTPKAPDKEP